MAFWTWFQANAMALANALQVGDTAEVEEHMKEGQTLLPPRLGWEIGPGAQGGHMLAFSLNGDLENLRAAEELVASAPSIPGWEFHAGRPVKRWDLRFSLRNQLGRRIDLDANKWRYSLVGFEDCKYFDIRIVCREAELLDDDSKQRAARVVLQGLLGERKFLEAIDRVRMVAGHDDDEALTEMRHLPAHLSSLQ